MQGIPLSDRLLPCLHIAISFFPIFPGISSKEVQRCSAYKMYYNASLGTSSGSDALGTDSRVRPVRLTVDCSMAHPRAVCRPLKHVAPNRTPAAALNPTPLSIPRPAPLRLARPLPLLFLLPGRLLARLEASILARFTGSAHALASLRWYPTSISPSGLSMIATCIALTEP